MAKIQWQTAFETGISEIDNQHMKFVELMNRLESHLSAEQEVDPQTVRPVLADLVEYATVHFAFEQKFQQEMAFSEHLEHVERHNEFLAWIKSNFDSPDLQNSGTITALLNYLMDWFLKHLLVEDMKFGREYAQMQQSSGRATAVV
ncbi:MAG: hemerythrin family protein [bacterium]|nr:hemerythrin family protein [bacterium]